MSHPRLADAEKDGRNRRGERLLAARAAFGGDGAAGVLQDLIRDGRRTSLPYRAAPVMAWLIDMLAVFAATGIVGALGGAAVASRAGLDIDRVALVAAVCLTGFAQFAGAYEGASLLSLKQAIARMLNAWCGSIFFLVLLSQILRTTPDIPLRGLGVWVFICANVLVAGRCLTVALACQLKQTGVFNCRSAIVGAGVEGVDLARFVMNHADLTLSLVGMFDDRPPSERQARALPLPYLGGLAELVSVIRAGIIDRVFIALPWSEETRVRAIVDVLALTPVEIRLAPDRAAFAFAEKPVILLGGLPVIELMDQPMTGLQRVQKNVEDRVLSFLGLVLCLPLFAVIALAIRIDTPGPVLFRQTREGFNCTSFSIFKFRTMRAEACTDARLIQACRRDPRTTRVGAWLRRLSLDELPQLLNVLLGHMSLVGPRPHARSTSVGGRPFAEIAASYAARHNVKPGLTGWAQVNGWRGETDTEEKLVRRLEHDLHYVENWSIWFDVYILARTAATLFFQRSAY